MSKSGDFVSNISELFTFDCEYRRGIKSMNKFAEILNRLYYGKNIKEKIDISNYKYIHPCYAVLLAAIPYVAHDRQNDVPITYLPTNKKCVDFLNNSGILKHYVDNNFSGRQKNAKKSLGDFNVLRNEEGIEATIERVLKNMRIDISDTAYAELNSRIYEVFSNAWNHGKSGKVFSCGSLDNQKSLVFSIYDDGIGIPKNVNDYLITINKPPLTDIDAVNWALVSGNSTLNGRIDYPRGVGLSVLVNFANQNSGEIIIASGEAYIIIAKNKIKKYTLTTPLPGTYFSIIIKEDLSHRYVKNDNIIERINL